MTQHVNLIHLAAKVGQAKPNLDPLLISKNVVKMQKLAHTIRKRDAWPYQGGQISLNTESFCRKAEDLAHEIGCEFVTDDSPLGEFCLRIDDCRLERLL